MLLLITFRVYIYTAFQKFGMCKNIFLKEVSYQGCIYLKKKKVIL